MKTADDRLRAAARDAMRIFPPGSDLPPLRLPDLTSGDGRTDTVAGRRAAVGGTGRARAWLAPLAAAAAVAVVIAGVVALRQPMSGAGRASNSSLATRNAQARAKALQQRERDSFDALVVASVAPATGPMYDDGTKLMWMIQARELQATARCMAAAGYHISDHPGPFDPAAFADNTQMPDLPRIARTHEFVPLGGLAVPDYTKAEQKAVSACSATADVPYRQLLVPLSKLRGSWWAIVFRIQASAPVQAAIPALNACAARYGFPGNPYGPVSAPIKSFADFMDWIAGFLDGAGTRSASTSTLQALDRHWSAVFVACARPIVGIWQRMQLGAQPGFLAVHASQLRQVDALAWQLLGNQPNGR
jgi:hypothetical protein